MSPTQKIKNSLFSILKKKETYFCAFLIFFNLITGRNAFKENRIGGFKYLFIVSIVIEIALLFFVAKFKNAPKEKLFLIFCIPIGLIYILTLPCGQSPDDYTHFARIYGIIEGSFIVPHEGEYANGGKMPKDAINSFSIATADGNYKKIANNIFKPKMDEEEYFSYPASALYNPACYLPQIIGVFIGKIFSSSILLMAYLGRLFNFVVFVALLYFSIKLIPMYKNFLLLLACLPITIQEATSLAPDSLAIGLTFFITSFVLYLTFQKNKNISNKELIILYASAIMIGFCKIVYLPIILLYFIIPKTKFGGMKHKIFHAAFLATLVIGINTIWLVISSKYLIEIRDGVNSAEQAVFIVHHPFAFLEILIITIDKMLLFYIQTGLGMYLGPLSIQMPNLYFFITIIFIVLILAQNSDSLKITSQNKLLVIVTFSAICLLIFTSLFLQWTPVGGGIIEGVQGRYFLPILPLVPIIINPTKKPKAIRQSFISTQNIIYYSIFFNMSALTMIVAANI